jgi:hypothetical protein
MPDAITTDEVKTTAASLWCIRGAETGRVYSAVAKDHEVFELLGEDKTKEFLAGKASTMSASEELEVCELTAEQYMEARGKK